MKDQSITSALLHLRVQIVRDGLDGLNHVEALLRMRGVDLTQHRILRRPSVNRFRNGQMRRLVLDALRDGPKRGCEVAAYVADRAPSVSYRQARGRVYQALARMKVDGVVGREGRLWGLAQ
jgi:hypothetical protein